MIMLIKLLGQLNNLGTSFCYHFECTGDLHVFPATHNNGHACRKWPVGRTSAQVKHAIASGMSFLYPKFLSSKPIELPTMPTLIEHKALRSNS